MKNVIVIGSGIAGLASSIRLAVKGYSVKVFEANPYPGGKISSVKIDRFRFDGGPPLLTMPNYIIELFELAGENPDDYFKYKKKEVSCVYFWNDGTKFIAHSDSEKFATEASKTFDESEKKIKKYFERAKKKYDLIASIFLEKSLHKTKTYFSSKILKSLFQLRIFEIQKSLHQANTDSFDSKHLIQFLDRYATYNGSNPYQTSGIMSVIQHLEKNYGTYVAKKGMFSIAESLFELAKKVGVKFDFETTIDEIIIDPKKKIKGVKSKGKTHNSDIVISNMDIFYTYNKLIKNVKIPSSIMNQERSSSAVIFYWGIKKTFEELDLHNIFFSTDYKNEFKSIFEDKKVCNDPTIYINISSKEIPSDAPRGFENWYVMINTPPDYGQDWSKIVKNLRSIVIKKISARLGVNVEEIIICEKIITPALIQKNSKSYMGALYGTSSNDLFSAFLRHPNFSNRIKNLYFCGGSVHPGGGIPLCLLSAKIVDDLIPKL
tara:strand:- start:130 stop:1599 length:1470 start_codon:yes stop_codon:yes gene_type:complete